MAQIKIEIPEQIIEDNLIGAFDSMYGSAWSLFEFIGFRNRKPETEKVPDSRITTPLSSDGAIILRDREDDTKHTLTRAKILKGLVVMAQKNPYQFGELLSSKGDSITAELMIQFAIFGEEKYA